MCALECFLGGLFSGTEPLAIIIYNELSNLELFDLETELAVDSMSFRWNYLLFTGLLPVPSRSCGKDQPKPQIMN